MRRLAVLLVVLATCAATVAAAGAQTSARTLTAAQLTAQFRKATGERLVVNKTISYPGHYTAYDLGVQTVSRRLKFGTFTVYVVTAPQADPEVSDLLADAHTGLLGTPGAGNIYWEPGTSIHGDKYWLAKRRYGANVVLYWMGATPVKKTDVTFKRLHAVLTAATR
jgi:hypothetical protein